MILTVDVELGRIDPYVAPLVLGSHQVLSATSPSAVLKILGSQPVDLVLINDAIGLELLREIHAHGHQDLVTIVISDRPRMVVAREAMLLGAYAYITRPCDPQLLRAMLVDASVPCSPEEGG
ncbi:MAG: response regulator [Myxococcota bacterium]